MQRGYRVRRPSSSFNQFGRTFNAIVVVMGEGHGKAASSHTQRNTRLRSSSPIRPHAAQESQARTIPGISALVIPPANRVSHTTH